MRVVMRLISADGFFSSSPEQARPRKCIGRGEEQGKRVKKMFASYAPFGSVLCLQCGSFGLQTREGWNERG